MVRKAKARNLAAKVETKGVVSKADNKIPEEEVNIEEEDVIKEEATAEEEAKATKIKDGLMGLITPITIMNLPMHLLPTRGNLLVIPVENMVMLVVLAPRKVVLTTMEAEEEANMEAEEEVTIVAEDLAEDMAEASNANITKAAMLT